MKLRRAAPDAGLVDSLRDEVTELRALIADVRRECERSKGIVAGRVLTILDRANSAPGDAA